MWRQLARESIRRETTRESRGIPAVGDVLNCRAVHAETAFACQSFAVPEALLHPPGEHRPALCVASHEDKPSPFAEMRWRLVDDAVAGLSPSGHRGVHQDGIELPRDWRVEVAREPARLPAVQLRCLTHGARGTDICLCHDDFCAKEASHGDADDADAASEVEDTRATGKGHRFDE